MEDPDDETEQCVEDPVFDIDYSSSAVREANVEPKLSTNFANDLNSNSASDHVHVVPFPDGVSNPTQYQSSVDDTNLPIRARVEDCSALDVYCDIDSAVNNSHTETPVVATDNPLKSSVRPKRQVGKPKWMEDYVVD